MRFRKIVKPFSKTEKIREIKLGDPKSGSLNWFFQEPVKDCLNNLHEFGELGVEFVSLKDSGIDMTTPSGKLLLHILAAFAEFEASIIKMRVMAGLDLARKRGKKLGRPKKRDDDKIRRLRQEGNSLRDIARLAGVSTTAVQRCLKAVTKSCKSSARKASNINGRFSQFGRDQT